MDAAETETELEAVHTLLPSLYVILKLTGRRCEYSQGQYKGQGSDPGTMNYHLVVAPGTEFPYYSGFLTSTRHTAPLGKY